MNNSNALKCLFVLGACIVFLYGVKIGLMLGTNEARDMLTRGKIECTILPNDKITCWETGK